MEAIREAQKFIEDNLIQQNERQRTYLVGARRTTGPQAEREPAGTSQELRQTHVTLQPQVGRNRPVSPGPLNMTQDPLEGPSTLLDDRQPEWMSRPRTAESQPQRKRTRTGLARSPGPALSWTAVPTAPVQMDFSKVKETSGAATFTFSGLGEVGRTQLALSPIHPSTRKKTFSTNLGPIGRRSTSFNQPTAAADLMAATRMNTSAPALQTTAAGVTAAAASEHDSSQESGSATNTVTSHIRTKRKAEDWSLCVRKSHLILGDSNLARIPPFRAMDLQVESFPGATFAHLISLMENTRVETNVKIIILSFGINYRNRKYISPIKKQIEEAVVSTFLGTKKETDMSYTDFQELSKSFFQLLKLNNHASKLETFSRKVFVNYSSCEEGGVVIPGLVVVRKEVLSSPASSWNSVLMAGLLSESLGTRRAAHSPNTAEGGVVVPGLVVVRVTVTKEVLSSPASSWNSVLMAGLLSECLGTRRAAHSPNTAGQRPPSAL
ncbi:unnamed protein product [Menidia menidia]|uniref:(Atlantic silverside) hypothetical protein n=1 Tax=Menidia menidia TaxID=238744 RepID=A0A8S4BTZ9_9TELE|nr:unnamed protein product [Menidia menidia]